MAGKALDNTVAQTAGAHTNAGLPSCVRALNGQRRVPVEAQRGWPEERGGGQAGRKNELA